MKEIRYYKDNKWINITNSCRLNSKYKVLILADFDEFVNDIHEFRPAMT